MPHEACSTGSRALTAAPTHSKGHAPCLLGSEICSDWAGSEAQCSLGQHKSSNAQHRRTLATSTDTSLLRHLPYPADPRLLPLHGVPCKRYSRPGVVQYYDASESNPDYVEDVVHTWEGGAEHWQPLVQGLRAGLTMQELQPLVQALRGGPGSSSGDDDS